MVVTIRRGGRNSAEPKTLKPSQAIDLRNILLGVAARYELGTLGERHELNEAFKYAAKVRFGWLDSSGGKYTTEAVVQDLRGNLEQVFGTVEPASGSSR